MKILIINLPRTGSTSFHTKLVKETGGISIFNPYDGTNRTSILKKDNIVVKSGILYPQDLTDEQRIDFYINLISDFDTTYLLSRRNVKEHIESWAYMVKHNTIENWEKSQRFGINDHFTSLSNYVFDDSTITKEDYEKAKLDLENWNNILNLLSRKTSIPITHYEDIFDANGKDRYRKTKIQKLI